MIEAVGYRFWPTYFQTLDRLVTPGGRVAIQAITMPHDRMLATRNTYTWIQKYIFPGGLLPSTEAIMAITERHTAVAHRRHVLAATALRRDAAAVAGALHRAPGCGGGVGFRRGLPPDVGAVPGLLRGRFPVRVSRRLPVDLRTDGRSIDELSSSSPQRRWRFWSWCTASPSSIGRRIGRYNVVDVTWGVGFVAVAAVAAAVGTGDLFRRLLLLVLVAVWGLRLAWHMILKSAGKGEDPRYETCCAATSRPATCCARCSSSRRAATWFVSLPLQVSAVLRTDSGGAVAGADAGVAVWVVGVLFEAVGDHQLRRFKADPANKGVIMDRGLWAWTRHPNYFGDACVWWGLWLATIAAWVSLLHSALTGADDLLPGVRHRCAADREAHGATGLDSANTVLAHHFSYHGRPNRDYHDDIDGGG